MNTIRPQRWLLNRHRFLCGLGAAIGLSLLSAITPSRAAEPSAAKPRIVLPPDESRTAAEFFASRTNKAEFQRFNRQLCLAHREVGLEFVKGTNTFRLARLCGIETGQEFLSKDPAADGLWQLVLRREQGRDTKEVVVNSNAGAMIAHGAERGREAVTLRLQWKSVPVAQETNALDVEVSVTLRDGDPLSRWRIRVTNRSRTWGLWNVIFPVLELAPLGREPAANFLALGRSRGIVVPDPFRKPDGRVAFGMMSASGGYWPGTFNMQFQALYDREGTGLYLATHDGGGYKKSFYILPQPNGRALEYKVGHWPANMGWPAENYQMTSGRSTSRR